MRATDDKVTGSEKAGEMERIPAQINRPRMREREADLNFFCLDQRLVLLYILILCSFTNW